jgi:hypothetical protein
MEAKAERICGKGSDTEEKEPKGTGNRVQSK